MTNSSAHDRDDTPWPTAETTVLRYSEVHGRMDAGVIERSNVFLQWKGTDVCFDFWCECGGGGHFDGYFASQFRCSTCGAVYAMPVTIYPAKLDHADTRTTAPRNLDDPDEDACDTTPPAVAVFDGHPEHIVFDVIAAHAAESKIDANDIRWRWQATALADRIHTAMIEAGYTPPEASAP